MEFTDKQQERYSRHIILPEVGGKGQKKIFKAKVLIVGAGGLGCPIGYYLAAAGVGKIGLVDNDKVELSNLQRQIAHSIKTIDVHKADSAKQTFEALNPDVNVVPIKTRINAENIIDIIRDYDIIVDGTDNFPTRYLINDACVLSKKPLVTGAILRFDGQVKTIMPGEGCCYRCWFPESPPPGESPSCQEAGVLGVLPGVIGTLQAMEVLKIILGKGELLSKHFLLYDALHTTFARIMVFDDPNCVVCKKNSPIKELKASRYQEESCII